jgi:hypothetical protein
VLVLVVLVGRGLNVSGVAAGRPVDGSCRWPGKGWAFETLEPLRATTGITKLSMSGAMWPASCLAYRP